MDILEEAWYETFKGFFRLKDKSPLSTCLYPPVVSAQAEPCRHVAIPPLKNLKLS